MNWRRSLASAADRVRAVPIDAVLVGLGLFVLLTLFISADAPRNATYSLSPFTDEGFNSVNSRNLIQLGYWSSDEWARHLVELPFSVLEAVVFRLIGVGIVQARLPMILCVSLTATALVWGLRGIVDRAWAVFAGLAFAGSGLILFYGRLVYFEDLVVLAVTLGTLVLLRESLLSVRGGILSGLLYAVAIGTKPNAVVAIVGIMVVLGAIWGWRNSGMRRWLGGTAAVIAASGLAWAVLIWLPNQSAVAIDVSTWPPLDVSLTPAAVIASVREYIFGGSDHVVGTLLGPLLVLGAGGTAAIVVFRRRVTETQARLAAAAFGWVAFGFAILLVVSYRPNRYAVPLVPPLAILAAIGFHVAGQWIRERLASRNPQAVARITADEPADGGVGSKPELRGLSRFLRSNAVALLAAVAVLTAVAPGLRLYGIWGREATYNLVNIQARFATAVPPGERVAGRDAALFLMDSRAVTIIVGLANKGDLYAQGVRWYLVITGDPAPKGVPDSAWADRRELMCGDYGASTECLVQVP
jgi:hypothetical protein